MQGINGDDGLIELKIAILVINQGCPVGTDVGAAVRPGKDRLRMEAPWTVAPVETVVAEGLRAAIGKVDGAPSNGRRRAVAGGLNDLQITVGPGHLDRDRPHL